MKQQINFWVYMKNILLFGTHLFLTIKTDLTVHKKCYVYGFFCGNVKVKESLMLTYRTLIYCPC